MHAVLLPIYAAIASLALLPRFGAKVMLYEFTLFGPIIFFIGAVSAT
jgi:hypothetical protein